MPLTHKPFTEQELELLAKEPAEKRATKNTRHRLRLTIAASPELAEWVGILLKKFAGKEQYRSKNVVSN